MTSFRDATLADLPAVVRLLADDPFGAGREWATDPLPDRYRRGFEAMRAQGGRLVVAVRDGAVVGCLQLHILHGVSAQGQSVAQIEGVRVDGALRGQGVGAAIVGHAIAAAQAAGCGAVQLTSRRERVDAQRFYAKLGFVGSHAGMKLSLVPI